MRSVLEYYVSRMQSSMVRSFRRLRRLLLCKADDRWRVGTQRRRRRRPRLEHDVTRKPVMPAAAAPSAVADAQAAGVT